VTPNDLARLVSVRIHMRLHMPRRVLIYRRTPSAHLTKVNLLIRLYNERLSHRNVLDPDVSTVDACSETPRTQYECLESRIRALGFIFSGGPLILDTSGARSVIEGEAGPNRVFCWILCESSTIFHILKPRTTTRSVPSGIGSSFSESRKSWGYWLRRSVYPEWQLVCRWGIRRFYRRHPDRTR
jgi:hypothetical protein